MKKQFLSFLGVGLLVFALFVTPAMAVTIYTTDFISNAERTGFNGFESISTTYYDGSQSYEEDGIRVNQILGDSGNDIRTIYTSWGGHEGNRSWYPNGGDYGYTEITLASGEDFYDDIGMNVGNYWGSSDITLSYELWDNGSLILSDSFIFFDAFSKHYGYLGFSGGGFDEIRLIATENISLSASSYIGDGTFQALLIDSIEMQSPSPAPVPEPSTMLLLGGGIIGLALYRRKRK